MPCVGSLKRGESSPILFLRAMAPDTESGEDTSRGKQQRVTPEDGENPERRADHSEDDRSGHARPVVCGDPQTERLAGAALFGAAEGHHDRNRLAAARSRSACRERFRRQRQRRRGPGEDADGKGIRAEFQRIKREQHAAGRHTRNGEQRQRIGKVEGHWAFFL